MNLKKLTDKELLKSTELISKREKSITLILLRHLREIDLRRCFADLGCSSLFNYCTDILGYSRAETHTRICAMGLRTQ
jgi:hypothetical protein